MPGTALAGRMPTVIDISVSGTSRNDTLISGVSHADINEMIATLRGTPSLCGILTA